MLSRPRPVVLALLLTTTLLAGCIEHAAVSTPGGSLAPESVNGGAGTSGGSIANVAPAWQSFTGSQTTVDNSGASTEVLTGRVFDANGEQDFAGSVLRINLSGSTTGSLSHVVTAQELAATAEPAAFGADGWKAWNGVLYDGVLHFKHRFTYPVGTPPGTATFTPSVTPAVGSAVSGAAKSTTVVAFTEITVSPWPVNAAGAAVTGTAWGGWSAVPNATNVESVNYLMLRNTGQKAATSMVIAFTQNNFTSPNTNISIPIRNNVEFAFAQGTASASPTGLAFGPWTAGGAERSLTVSFAAINNIIYVKYRIKQMPPVLPAETYGASYTVSELA